MDKIEDEADDILSDESDEDEAAEEVVDALKGGEKKIKKVNKKHDEVIIDTTRAALVADIQNDVAKASKVEELITTLTAGKPIEEEIESLKLPFELEVPTLIEEDDDLDVDRSLLCRDGKCVERLEMEPSLDSFVN